jgi:threonine dehydratase/RimJ/RimL family protein N-acetyltransferase
MTPTLETKRLILRPLAIEDADQVQILFPQWEIVRHLNAVVPWPYPPDGARTFFRDVALPAMARGDEWIWTIRPNGDPDRIIGSIGLKRSDDENRGFWLDPAWQGQGLMTEAANAVTDFWFDTLKFPVLRVPKAVANTASRRVSEKQGMRVVAVMERDYVSGRAQAEIWEVTAHEWRARRVALRLEPRRITEARALLATYFGPTPLTRSAALSTDSRDVHFKIETGLPTGSFKIRGAIYSLSVNLARRAVAQVVAASTGNHGAAVAYAGRVLGVPVTIFLPTNPNPVKAATIRDAGAEIVEAGADLSAAIDAATEYARTSGAFFLHDAADPDVPVGTATIGAEILEQLPEVREVFVPMGDTALIRGVASAIKQVRPWIRMVGVAAANAPAYQLSWESGEVVETASADTMADGLAVSRPLRSNVDAIRDVVDEIVLVTEEELLAAIRLLRDREQVVAEPAGAAATAALLKRGQAKGPSVVLVTGANIDPAHVESVMPRS